MSKIQTFFVCDHCTKIMISPGNPVILRDGFCDAKRLHFCNDCYADFLKHMDDFIVKEASIQIILTGGKDNDAQD